MPRLPRPSIPLEVKCRVALRQTGATGFLIPGILQTYKGHCGRLLELVLPSVASRFGCNTSDLRLDHDPALQNREKVFDKNGVHVDYIPDANDPDYLIYRPHGPEFEGSHLVKTLIRGDHGQYSDAALARKRKRIAAKENPKRKKAKIPARVNYKMPSRPFQQRTR